MQSGWSAVTLVIIIFSRHSKKLNVSFLNRKLLRAEVMLKFFWLLPLSGQFQQTIYLMILFLFFQPTELDISCKLSLLETISWNVKSSFLGKLSKKTISKCYLLKIDVQHSLGNFTRQHIDDMFIFPENNLIFGDNLHEMSNPVSLENKKIFQNVCWKLMLSTLGAKFNIQHFEIFFLFPAPPPPPPHPPPKKKNKKQKQQIVLGKISSICHHLRN